MSKLKIATIGIRMPPALKAAVARIAEVRMTSESEICREALLEYLRARGIELSEEATRFLLNERAKQSLSYSQPPPSSATAAAAVGTASAPAIPILKRHLRKHAARQK